MRCRLFLVALVAMSVSSLSVQAQSAPTIKVDPVAVVVGKSTTVDGVNFEPGLVRIFLDSTTASPVAEVDHVGAFNFLVEIAGVAEGPHTVIACNNQSRTGACRQEATANLRVISDTTTTTTTTAPPTRVTTTTRPPSATTTTLPPRATTTVASATVPTTVPTTVPPRATTTVAPQTTTVAVATTLPQIVTIAPTTIGGIAVATTVAPPPTGPGNVAASIPSGPDPTFDPTPGDIAIVTTTEGPSFQSGSSGDEYPDLSVVAIEVTQGIQDLTSRMPLVADRTTWIRVHVDSAGDNSWAPIDGAILLQRAGVEELIRLPENGPIATKQPRTNINSTLNFEVPGEFIGDGQLTITALVWSFKAASLDTVEPNPANNQMQETVEFHTADIPTVWLVALDDGGGPGEVVTDLNGLLGFAQIVHQDMLDYHPTALVNYEAYPAVVEPGPEALVPGEWKLGWAPGDDPDADDNEDTDMPRRTEPNVRLAWLTADLPEEANVLGMFDPTIPADGYSGWAKHGVSWTKPKAGTPAHELGHNRGLKHVACKDADDDGIPDEIKGGAIDPHHPTGLPPQCSLAPISPTGYYGLTTERNSLTVYSNDPTDAAAAYPFMSYKRPGWTDPYDWCLLLDFVSVPCGPATTGIAPKVLQPAADCDPQPVGNGLGLDLCLINQLPPVEPFAVDPVVPFGGSIQYAFEPICEAAGSLFMRLSDVQGETPSVSGPPVACTQNAAGDGTNPAGDGTTEHFFTVDISEDSAEPGVIITPDEPDAWMLVSGFVDLATGEVAIQQAASRDTLPDPLRRRYLDNVEGVLSGASPMPYALRVRTEDGGLVSQVPLDLDGAGHGDGGERGDLVSFFQAVPAAAGCHACWVDLMSFGGPIYKSVPSASLAISPLPPVVESVVATDVGDATLIEWVAADPDGDPLTFDVLWSVDGEEWLHAATDIGDASVTVPHDARYPGGDDVKVRVVANDGSRTGEATSAPFSAPGHDPLLIVTGLPEEGVVEQYDTLLLQAHAVDPEDQGTQADTVVWRSDLEGEVATGPLLRSRDLQPGVHSFSVEATDSDGNTAVQSFQLDVAPRTSPTRYLESPDETAVAKLTGVSTEATESLDSAVDAGQGAASAAEAPGIDPAVSSPSGDGGSSRPLVIGLAAVAGAAGAAAWFARRRSRV